MQVRGKVVSAVPVLLEMDIRNIIGTVVFRAVK